MPKAFLVRKRPVPHTTWKDAEGGKIQSKKQKLAESDETKEPTDDRRHEELIRGVKQEEQTSLQCQRTETPDTHASPCSPHNSRVSIETTDSRAPPWRPHSACASRDDSVRSLSTKPDHADNPFIDLSIGGKIAQALLTNDAHTPTRTTQRVDSVAFQCKTKTPTSIPHRPPSPHCQPTGDIDSVPSVASDKSAILGHDDPSDGQPRTNSKCSVASSDNYSSALESFPSPLLGHPPTSVNHFPFPPPSFPLSPRQTFFPSPPPPPPHHHHNHPHPHPHHQRMFSFPPNVVRPIPTPALPWPIQPVPLRLPLGLRPNFGVMSPEEVPSPPGSSVADVPSSPLLCVRSPAMDPLQGLAESVVPLDYNNNNSSICSGGGGGGGGGGPICLGSGEDTANDGRRNQSFKDFLETAKVRVETINDGNGLKNPLLSPEKSRLPLDPGPLSLMTLDAFPACPVCGLKCDTPRLLQRHVRSHKEIKRYLCAWCGKGFNDTFDLKRHTRTHTGVRPYKCECCGKAFTQRCSLESHCRKIHGQNLPFSFNERRTKLYVCEECGHSTPSIDLHFNHLRAQHPGHPALGRPHHDRRQFKFMQGNGEGNEEDEGEEEGEVDRVVVGEKKQEQQMGRREDSEACKTIHFGLCPEGERFR